MVILTDYQKGLLNKRQQVRRKQGRFSASISLKARRVYRERQAYGEAEGEFKVLLGDPFFVHGLTLYIAHGSKRGLFGFTHSDPDLVLLMTKWVEIYLNKSGNDIKYRVIAYEAYKDSNLELFWSRALGITVGKLSKTTYKKSAYFDKKSPNYKGSLAITVSGIGLLRKVLAWQNLLIKYYKDTVGVVRT
jgi:hypothetical protein